MGLNNPTLELQAEGQDKKFIQKINKARLMTFLVKVNFASSKIQKAYKNLKKRRQFYKTLQSMNQAGAGAEKSEFLELLSKLQLQDEQDEQDQ
ncbi:hypothetical protein TTHERM_00429980 (macronuclear) [Tetrahymena thermophila SB210]|uniref:Uncharacterized protein n=1 Tax=Tetrahymena thermophila (strain SB210) TaxID=312017 RepID=Q231G2_TETTS|nr:hypothetical protein TTHERM_00429980 [Tetrahymena thermophila SB210]EAR91077.1 hypothetical protein TTHERM_00429980 [Tetrahymena thermophila SB210]|eukprot:XP_001011322.1 hypothetical protein TTHERM_00429980 [Tetrahymena thermophila SB210]